ncbi:MAG: hypothetical protein LBQ75_08160, partial [Zoogloeaceae bacterium]|nr:hypothetical protein [Zoogloeaceae bacterium]
MTFERNPILEEKLLLLRARKYANSLASLDGVDAVSVSLLKEDDFLWHRQEMRKTYAIDREIEGIVYPLPVNADDLIQQITGLLDLSDQFSCYFFYEGACIITINGNSFRKFLMSFFEMQQTYDLGLIFINPDRILTVDDGEYDLFIYHNCAVPMNDDVLHTDGKDRHYSPFIRGISILVNTVGMAFYLGLSYVSLSSSTSMGGAWV